MKKAHHRFGLIGVLGVVYGDIGTSPLYAIKECFLGSGLATNEANILGVLSLVFWSLMLVVTFKYVMFMLKANNHGEGGIFALLALINNKHFKLSHSSIILMLGFVGASLFFGDGIITPAISVLSALEGLKIINPLIHEKNIMICSMIIIIGLFFMQSKGTGYLGKLFGPIMLVWFGVLGFFGILQIINSPVVLKAFNPLFALNMLLQNPVKFLTIMGFVVLCITGAEALYADMGHFSKKEIRISWVMFVFPSLLLNYFGQGAWLLTAEPSSIINPFYEIVPQNLRMTMVVLSTFATIIASQSVISGIFSMFHQAIQLGYLPNLKVKHTSAEHYGRIYIPSVNWLLCICVVAAIIWFRNSNNLAAIYGLSVTGLMLITGVLAMFAAHKVFRWRKEYIAIVVGIMLLIDSVLFASSLYKASEGIIFPVGVALLFLIVMHTWYKQGKQISDLAKSNALTYKEFFQKFKINKIVRAGGTTVFLSKDEDCVPYSLIKRLTLTESLPEHVIILTIVTHNVPYVPRDEFVFIQKFGGRGFKQIVGHYGFMQKPNIMHLLKAAHAKDADLDINNCSFVLLKAAPYLSIKVKGINRLQAQLFDFIYRNSQRTADYFDIPRQRIIEMGMPVKIN